MILREGSMYTRSFCCSGSRPEVLPEMHNYRGTGGHLPPSSLMHLLSLSLSFSVLFACSYALTWKGADFSSVGLLSTQFHDASTSSSAQPFEKILAEHGTNLARIRIWTSTDDTQYSLNYGLSIAKRAVAVGMSLLVDLHYSDTCMSIFYLSPRIIND